MAPRLQKKYWLEWLNLSMILYLYIVKNEINNNLNL